MSPRALTLVICFLVVAFVNAHDLHQRGHHDYNMKRAVMRKRAPLPQGPGSIIPNPLPASSVVEPTSSGRDPAVSISSSTAPLPSSTTSASRLLSSTSSLPSSSVSQRSASSTLLSESSSSPPQITSTTDDGAGGVSTIIVPGVTRTSSVLASDSVVPDKQGNTSSSAKGTTLTVLIAVAASIGGIFILWTIFRKWKLSSSKEFDRRLNPIDWQPTTTGEDEQIPGLARRPSIGSLHSSGHGHGAGLSRAPSDHSHSNPFDDFDPVQQPAPVQVGGYADLARGSSPTQMQERTQYGSGYNHGATPLPLHHQSGY